MNLLELVDKRDLKFAELEGYTNKMKVEHRKMNENENLDFINLKNEIEKMNKEIEDIQNADKKMRNSTSIIKNNEKKHMNEFSLIKAVREAVDGGRFSEATLEVLEEGKRNMVHGGQSFEGSIQLPMQFEKRGDLVTGTDAQGGFAISKDYFNILKPLTANLVFTQAGATYLTGLSGNLVIPTYTGSASNWAAETTAAADGAGTFGQVTLSPKKLTTILTISKMMLNQDSLDVENMLRQNLIISIASKLESTILGKHATAVTTPDGFYTVTGQTYYAITSGATYSKIVGMEGTIDTSNALTGNLAYITHPKVKSLLKTTAKFATVGNPIMEGNDVNGYPTFVTSNMSTGLATAANESGIIFGNWADYYIAQWGALDILVDPYTKGAEGQVRLVVTGFFDAKPIRTASFAVGSVIA